MKQKKRLLTLVLALVLCFTLSTTSFAADTNNMPEVKKETVTFSLDAGESTMAVQPRIWGNNSYNVTNATYTTYFTIPDRYFAYDCSVSLMYNSSSAHCVLGVAINGSTYKKDWIEVNAGSSYLFRICNYSNTNISVTITYYSWA